MKKKIVLGSIFAVCILMMLPAVSAVGYNVMIKDRYQYSADIIEKTRRTSTLLTDIHHTTESIGTNLMSQLVKVNNKETNLQYILGFLKELSENTQENTETSRWVPGTLFLIMLYLVIPFESIEGILLDLGILEWSGKGEPPHFSSPILQIIHLFFNFILSPIYLIFVFLFS